MLCQRLLIKFATLRFISKIITHASSFQGQVNSCWKFRSMPPLRTDYGTWYQLIILCSLVTHLLNNLLLQWRDLFATYWFVQVLEFLLSVAAIKHIPLNTELDNNIESYNKLTVHKLKYSHFLEIYPIAETKWLTCSKMKFSGIHEN